MRIFCNITPALNITRQISGNVNARQYSSLAQIVQCSCRKNNGYLWSTNITWGKLYNEDKSINKQSDKTSKSSEVDNAVETSGGNCILPVALIDLNPLSSTSTKILLFPLHWANHNEAIIKNALISIFSQHGNIRKIEAFSNALTQIPQFQQNVKTQKGEIVKEHNVEEEKDVSHGVQLTEIEKGPVLTVLQKSPNLSLMPCQSNSWGNLYGLPDNFSTALQNIGFIVNDNLGLSSCPSDKSYSGSGNCSCQKGQPLSLAAIMKYDALKLNFDEFVYQRKFPYDPLNFSTRSFCTRFIDAMNKLEIKTPKIYEVQDPYQLRLRKKKAKTDGIGVLPDFRHISYDSSSLTKSSLVSSKIRHISRQSTSFKVTLYNSPFVSELLGGHKYPMSCDTYRKALVEAAKRRAALKNRIQFKRLKDCSPTPPINMNTAKTPVLTDFSDGKPQESRDQRKVVLYTLKTHKSEEGKTNSQTKLKYCVSPPSTKQDPCTELKKGPCQKANIGDNIYLDVFGMPRLNAKLIEPVLQLSKAGIGMRGTASTSGLGGKNTPAVGGNVVSKDKRGGVKGKFKRPNPCGDVESEYKPKCNIDPCSGLNDPCIKPAQKCPGSDKNNGPCAKKEAKKKDDPCAKNDAKKNDPREKKPKPKSKSCTVDKKKSDTRIKKGEKKKSDPCAKKDDKKKSDHCAKKDVKNETNPGAKKNPDPCGKTVDKKKPDPCAKKDVKKETDPCAKKNPDPCGKTVDKKKPDPCAKKDVKKETDPCAKKNPDPCGKTVDKKKPDPCAKKDVKKETDPCAKMNPDPEKKPNPCVKKDVKKVSDPCAKMDNKKKSDPCAKKNVKKTSDPCAKRTSDHCAMKDDKKKTDICGKKDVKKTIRPCSKNKADPCSKKDDKKKPDPCAQKKPDSKQENKIHDPCANKEKKADPCAKQEKKGTDVCDTHLKKPSDMHEMKIFDPCAKKQKKSLDPCSKPKDKPTKKCFSTTSLCQSQVNLKPNAKYFSMLAVNTPKILSESQCNDHIDTKTRIWKLNNILESFGFMRHYSSKDEKSKKDSDLGISSKCKSLATKKPPNRRENVNLHPKDGLRLCYPSYDMECPKKLCKDPKKTACNKYAFLKDTDNNKRKGEVSTPIIFPSAYSMQQHKRKFHTSFEWNRNFSPKDYNFYKTLIDSPKCRRMNYTNECNDEGRKCSQAHGLFNAALSIKETCKVERVTKLLFALSIEALPATSTPATTHIVSYVKQRKATKSPNGGHDEFSEFDFENFRSNLTAANPEMQGALQHLFGRFVENLESNLDSVDKDLLPKMARVNETAKDNEIYMQDSDDLKSDQANTLDAGFGVNEQHESQINETVWQRSKLSIPVLESVRHLVHSVHNGALNNTVHASPTRHHQLLGGDASMGTMMPHNGSDTSTAIETEEDREMINGSNDLKFLEVLGSIGSRVWSFLSSLKQVFAASSGSASAALLAQSSSSSS